MCKGIVLPLAVSLQVSLPLWAFPLPTDSSAKVCLHEGQLNECMYDLFLSTEVTLTAPQDGQVTAILVFAGSASA